MRAIQRLSTTALAAALLFALAACQPGDKAGADKADAGADETAAAATADKDAIPGLPTEKDRNSYMVGMALAKQFEPMKDDIDVDVVVKALRDALSGGKTLMTVEQAQQVGESFNRKMQEKQMQKMVADAKQNADKGASFLAENAKKLM